MIKKYFSNWLDCALTYPEMSFAIPSYALVSRRLRHWVPLHKCYNNSFLVLASSSGCTQMCLGLESQHHCRHSTPNEQHVLESWKYQKDKCPCMGAEVGQKLRQDKLNLQPCLSLCLFPIQNWEDQGMPIATSYRKLVVRRPTPSMVFNWELSCSSQIPKASSLQAC